MKSELFLWRLIWPNPKAYLLSSLLVPVFICWQRMCFAIAASIPFENCCVIPRMRSKYELRNCSSPGITITSPNRVPIFYLFNSPYVSVISTFRIVRSLRPKPHIYLHQPPIPQPPGMPYLDRHSELSFPRLP